VKYKLGAAGSTHQLLTWSHGIFSPEENKQQFELYMMPFELYIMPDRQWDPGDTTELCAWYYKFIADVELDEHHIAASSLQKALGLQI
jgi:hypothetical protein